jgi:hypothetical protein
MKIIRNKETKLGDFKRKRSTAAKNVCGVEVGVIFQMKHKRKGTKRTRA